MIKKHILFLLLFPVLILLFFLNYGCHKTDTSCLLPNDSELAAMKSKWLHYNVGDTLVLISNYNDTNIFVCKDINSWVEEDKSDVYESGICCYIYSTRFSSDFSKYNFSSYEFYKNGVGVFCEFTLKSNNTIFLFDNNYSEVSFVENIIINNNSFTEVYKMHKFKDADYDIYYSPSDGLIKLSIDNDSLYFMPEEYW